MIARGNFGGTGGSLPTRNFRTRRTVVVDQLVCHDETAGQIADIDAPASVNDYTEALGVTLEAVTYAAGQGNDATRNIVRCTFSPNQYFYARCSGGTTSGTALAEGTDLNLLTNTSASATGVVMTDADVGTSDFIGGYHTYLTGNNKGQRRTVTSHSDNTSETVTDAFPYAIAVGDRAVRTFGFGEQGQELTTDFTQLNMVPGAGVDLPDSGHSIIWEVYVDYSNQGTVAVPLVFAEFVLSDHIFNSLA